MVVHNEVRRMLNTPGCEGHGCDDIISDPCAPAVISALHGVEGIVSVECRMPMGLDIATPHGTVSRKTKAHPEFRMRTYTAGQVFPATTAYEEQCIAYFVTPTGYIVGFLAQFCRKYYRCIDRCHQKMR